MATESPPAHLAPMRRSQSGSAWLYAKALWASLSIITMWLAVLFVGVFGNDFVASSASGALTKFPVVVLLLPFVLPATIAVARRGFAGASAESEES